MKKILTIFFTVLFVFAAITMAVSAAKIDVDDKGVHYSNLLDFNPETNALWAEQDADGNWVAKEIDIYEQPVDEDGKICSPILTSKYSSYAARKWTLSDDGEFMTITSTDSSVYPGVIFILDAAHAGEFTVGQESGNPSRAEFVKIRVRNFSSCDQISFGFTMNHTNNGNLMPLSTSELTVDANGKKYESSGEWQTYIFSMYELNMNTNYSEQLYDPSKEDVQPTSRWPGKLYEFAIYPFGYDVTDGTGNYPGAKIDIDYVVIGSRDYVTNYQSALEIKEGNIESLELVAAPTKTEYVVGEMLDLSGLELVAKFKDGTTETLTTPSASVSTFETATTNEVTLKYGAASVTYNVTVSDITGIEVITKPEDQKFEVAELADGFISDGYEVQVNYANGTSQILPNAKVAFSGDFNQAGTATVNVHYYGHADSFEVELIQVTDITITPKKEYRYGQTVAIGDFDIELTYSDGSKVMNDDAAIELTFNEDDIKKNKMKAPGTSTITITATNEDYNINFSKDVEITTEAPVDVKITKEPTKKEYQVNEAFDSKGMEIKLVYADGKEIKMDLADCTFSVSTAKAGTKSVTIRTAIPGISELFSSLKVKTSITVTGGADDDISTETPIDSSSNTTSSPSDFNALPIIIAVVAVVVLGGVAAVVVIVVKKKKN